MTLWSAATAVAAFISRGARAAARAIQSGDCGRRTPDETAVAVAQLELRICELQQRSREISLLFEMSELLHLGNDLIDTTDIVSSFGRRLFPIFDGAVYVIEPPAGVATLAVWWGARPEVATHDCCRDDGDETETLCTPMIAFGELIGVLTLRAHSAGAAKSTEAVAKTFADQLARAMASMRLQETLRTHAVRDALTGLFNRRYLEEALRREMQRCLLTNAPLSVILIDIDRFKSFNDTFGHAGGDALLQHFARFMEQALREEDVICRYGGEEFVVMLPNTPLDAAVDRANRLRAQLRALEPRLGEQLLGAVTISAGVASASEHLLDPDKLLDAADRALYRAKNSGRDRVIASTTTEVIGRDAAA